jgi:dimethylglycine dehydrogenase
MGKSYAMALVNADVAATGTDLTLHVVGVERRAKAIDTSPYDPKGKAMRA